jgi:hypothetical protein
MFDINGAVFVVGVVVVVVVVVAAAAAAAIGGVTVDEIEFCKYT